MFQNKKTVKTAIIGLGNMGKKHLKTVINNNNTSLIATVDPENKEADYRTVNEMLDYIKPDCAIIASPTSNHIDAAAALLKHDIDLLIEKPVVSTREQIEEIKALSSRSKAVIAVGHIERFNPTIQTLKEDLEGQTIIDFYAKRVSPLPGRISDVGVSLDLAVHDIDLARFLTGKTFTGCHSQKTSLKTNNVEDNITISLKQDATSQGSFVVNCSWSYPFRERRIKILTDKFYYDVDLLNKIVSKMEGSVTQRGYHLSDLHVGNADPLENQLNNFLNLIETNKNKNIASLEDGILALSLAMEACK